MNVQKHLFVGGLNSDDDFQLFPAGDYVDALNFRTGSSQSGREGAGEIIWGTQVVDSFSRRNQDNATPESYTPSFPVGTECIGALEDRANNRCFFFLYRPDGNHGIYYYKPEDQTIYAVIEGAILNFQEGMRIEQAGTLDYYNPDGVRNTFLAYTDGHNAPKMFNVDLIEQTRWADITDYWLNLDKAPPVAPLKVNVRSEAGAVKELKEGVYQFVYRYLFKDGLRSTWSPISVPASITKSLMDDYGFNRIDLYQQYYMYGLTEAETAANDGLNDIPFGDPRLGYIDGIEIAYRYSELDNWQIVYRGGMQPKSTAVCTMTSNSNRGNVPLAEVLQPYSAVPLNSKALAVMQNRVFLGNNIVDLPEIKDFSFEEAQVYVVRNGEAPATDFLADGAAGDFTGAPELYKRNRFEINAFMDAFYSVGLVFKNENGHRSPVVTTPALRKRLAVIDDIIGIHLGMTALGFKIATGITPPEWATSYEVVRTRASNITFGFSGIANRFYFYKKDDAEPNGYKAVNSDDAAYFAVDISNFSQTTGADDPRTKDNLPNEIYYTYQEGDEIILSNLPTPFVIAGTSTDGKLLIANNDALKIAFGNQIDGNKVGKPFTVMIRTPQETETPPVFYSSGEWYPILNPKTENRAWSKSDWTYTGNDDVQEMSAGGFVWYDNYPFRNGGAYSVWKRYTFDYSVNITPNTNNLVVPYPQMNPFADKIAQQWEHGDLWIDVPNEFNTIKKLETQVVFGGQIIPDSRVNNLALFKADQQYVYPVDYGTLMELRPGQNQEVESAGAILVAGFVNETVAIYINRTTMANLNGSTEVLQSDKVLGSYNALVGSFGTVHPTATACVDGRQYRLDINKGVIHRYSRDGLTAISRFKMKKFFREKCNDLLYGNGKIYGGFDYEHQEYVLTLINTQSPNESVTIAFNEDKNRWVTRYSYLHECYTSIGNLFVSFRNGKLYRHNRLSESCNVFGEEIRQPSFVETVTNGLDQKMQSEIKEFENFVQEGDDKFIPVWMRTPERRNEYPRPETYTRADEIAEEEYKFKGAIYKNVNTVNASSEDKARLNGDAMKGYWLHTRWQYLPDLDPVAVFAINVGYNASNPTTGK